MEPIGATTNITSLFQHLFLGQEVFQNQGLHLNGLRNKIAAIMGSILLDAGDQVVGSIFLNRFTVTAC